MIELTGNSQEEDEEGDVVDDDNEDEEPAGDDWTTTDWDYVAEDQSERPAATNPGQIAEELRHLTRMLDVNDIVAVTCNICLCSRDSLTVLMDCGHLICRQCLDRQLRQICPHCRTAICRTTTILTSSINFVWNDDIQNEPEDDDDANLAGNRPADVPWQQQVVDDDHQFALQLQQAENGNALPGEELE